MALDRRHRASLCLAKDATARGQAQWPVLPSIPQKTANHSLLPCYAKVIETNAGCPNLASKPIRAGRALSRLGRRHSAASE